MDRTVACQLALAYRSPMISTGKPHGAIGSLHIAACGFSPPGVSQAVNQTLEALCGLGAKRPDCAAVLCQESLVLEDVLDAGAKPAGASGTRQFAATCADRAS